MNCPNCASDKTQRFSAIYEAGTSTVETTTSGGGVAFTNGGVAPILAASSSTGTQQTQLAARATPPPRRPVGAVIIAAVVASPILAVVVTVATGFACGLAGASSETIGTVTGAVSWSTLAAFSIGFVSLAFAGHSFNQKEWPALQEEWERKWFCYRCATEFVGRRQVRGVSDPLGTGECVSRSKSTKGEPSALFKTHSLKPVQTIVGLAAVAAILFGAMAVVSPSGPNSEPVTERPRPLSESSTISTAPPAQKGPIIVGTTLKEPWKFYAPLTVETAAGMLASVVVDFAAKSEPDELTNWEAQVIVIDRDMHEHKLGAFNFSFETIRSSILNRGSHSPELNPVVREQLDAWVKTELEAMEGIEILTSGQSATGL